MNMTPEYDTINVIVFKKNRLNFVLVKHNYVNECANIDLNINMLCIVFVIKYNHNLSHDNS